MEGVGVIGGWSASEAGVAAEPPRLAVELFFVGRYDIKISMVRIAMV